MRTYHICAAGFWVALGIFVSIYSYRLGLGNVVNPGPGLFPFCLGVILFVIATIVLTQFLITNGAPETERDKQPANPLKAIAALAVLFTSALLLEVLGYVLVTFAALAILFRIAGYKNIIQIVGYSVAIVGITYLLFTYLGVHFPPGILRFLGIY